MSHEGAFIQHLSKDIETQTTAMMTFRTRIGFVVFVGPALLLGSVMVGTKALPRVEAFTCGQGIVLAGLVIFYMGLGWICGIIERDCWDQCNHWRAMIASLADCEDVSKSDHVKFPNNRHVKTWVGAFALFFASFVALVFLIGSLFEVNPPASKAPTTEPADPICRVIDTRVQLSGPYGQKQIPVAAKPKKAKRLGKKP